MHLFTSIIKLVSFLLLSSVGPLLLSAQTDSLAHRIDFFLGEWDIEVVNLQGKVIGRARTVGRHILERKALQSDYFAMDANGNAVFRGTTIRTYVPASDHWVVHWAMANLNGYTYLQEKWVDGELHATGHGEDGRGKFLERYRYFNISPTTYSFEMDRTYDGGETWKQYGLLHARRRERG